MKLLKASTILALCILSGATAMAQETAPVPVAPVPQAAAVPVTPAVAGLSESGASRSDSGGVGVMLIVNPYTNLQEAFYQAEVPFAGGLGVFAEYMSRYVGVGFELDLEFLKADGIWAKESGIFKYHSPQGNEGRLGTVVHVWPYMRIRIPTRWVDPYFTFHLGYANYGSAFLGLGPYDGVAIKPAVGAAIKVTSSVSLLMEVGYNFAHYVSRHPLDGDKSIEMQNLVLNLGVMYRF